jgi:carbamoyltransferase
MVLEDALFHAIDGLIKITGSDRLVLTGGVGLNALANMHVLERFDRVYYEQVLRRPTRLHLWVPPVPGDAGTPVGATYAFAASVGGGIGPPLEHAFYCGQAANDSEILAALSSAENVAWQVLGNLSKPGRLEVIADLMAFITAHDGIIAVFQGAAETGPRALGHRSILANACNPQTRDLINERVKHREPIRPLAPMATLKAARDLFELSEGASDNNYNAYNYMVVTVRAKPHAKRLVPAVIHRDGTARIQIVRQNTDPLTYAYLKALGRRVKVEVAVNTSFNVAAPIAQTPAQALATLRRARALDGLFMVSGDGSVFLIWPHVGACAPRAPKWVAVWRCETGAMALT